MSDEPLLQFNGINAVSGTYSTEISPALLSQIVQGRTLDAYDQAHLRDLQERHRLDQGHAGFAGDRGDLAATGWGVVLLHNADARLLEALAPLLEHRRSQAGARYKEFYGFEHSSEQRRAGFRSGDSKTAFLKRHNASYGPVNADQVPYYLLLIGGPDAIPFAFQYQLDVQYAVGRLYFTHLEDYRRYAESVVAAETQMTPRPRRAVFFGPRTEGDAATIASADHLLTPLANGPANITQAMHQRIAQQRADIDRRARPEHAAQVQQAHRLLDAQQAISDDWRVDLVLGPEARRERLRTLLGGFDTPALLFTASHGLEFPSGHPQQISHQGALLCQEWPGPHLHQGAIPPHFALAGNDLPADATMLGQIAFFFACFGGGTPQFDAFAHAARQQGTIAPQPFVAHLPQRMLAHPNGGALAVVGHVERAWGYSFLLGDTPQLQVYQNMLLDLLLDELPIGAAMEWFNERYAEVASDLATLLEPVRFGKRVDDRQVVRLWTTNNDARGTVILGDPAVRLPVGNTSGPTSPPRIRSRWTAPAEPAEPAPPIPPVEPAPPAEPAVEEAVEPRVRPPAPRTRSTMSDEHEAPDVLVYNGLRAETGEYATRTTMAALANVAQISEVTAADEALRELQAEVSDRAGTPASYRVDGDTRDLAAVGWGVLFAWNADPAIYEALQPLLAHRRQQAGARYYEYLGFNDHERSPAAPPEVIERRFGGYRPGETKPAFAERHGAPTFGAVQPDRMPYYLLLVGGPDAIPFLFQYQLDVQHAVGRLHLDTPQAYHDYARSVVLAETELPPRPAGATFFGVRTEGDRATIASADNLIRPLVQEVLPAGLERRIATLRRTMQQGAVTKAFAHERIALCTAWGQQIQAVLAEEATKASLARLLGGPDTPALLFTASHGMEFAPDNPLQRRHQGALVCQDWPGPRLHQGPIPDDFYLSADDIGSDARLLGMIPFFFACFGGGTPQFDQFAHATRQQGQIAPQGFVARLPQRLLGHPNGGALAVVGHVERAWGHSFMRGRSTELQTFENALIYLMADGQPLGAAIEWFNERYAEIAAQLTTELEPARFGQPVNDRSIVNLWTTNNDARSYVILGDPAVRLNVAPVGAPAASRLTPAPVASVSPPIGAPATPPRPAAPESQRTTFKGAPREEEVSYGLFGFGGSNDDAEAGETQRALREVLDKMLQTLRRAVDDATSLEVNTFVSDEIDQVTYDMENGTFGGNTQLRARTRMSLDGDTNTVLPLRDGALDTSVWEVHSEIVRQAQQNRNEMIRILFALLRNQD